MKQPPVKQGLFPAAFKQIEDALRKIISVPKVDVDKRVREAKAQRSTLKKTEKA